MQSDLVDRIYESAFIPELWPTVLSDIADLAGARTGFLLVARKDIYSFTSSNPSGAEAIRPLVESGWMSQSDRYRRMRDCRHAGFVVEKDMYTPEELEVDPFYQDVIYPRGLGHGAGTTVHLPTGDSFIFALEREFIRGPVEPERIAQLDALRPHLGRGALMSTRMQLKQAATISGALGMIGLASAVIDDTGKVLAANPLLEALKGHIHWRAFGGVSLPDRAADGLLRHALAQIGSDGGGRVRSFPVRGAGEDSPMIAHVVPVRLSAHDIFSRASAVLVLTPVSLPNAASVELVQSLFDLTPAEARVARNLATGKTIDDIALDGCVSRNTIRTHVRGVLEKTGCGRQTDIVALLTAISTAMPVSAQVAENDQSHQFG